MVCGGERKHQAVGRSTLLGRACATCRRNSDNSDNSDGQFGPSELTSCNAAAISYGIGIAAPNPRRLGFLHRPLLACRIRRQCDQTGYAQGRSHEAPWGLVEFTTSMLAAISLLALAVPVPVTLRPHRLVHTDNAGRNASNATDQRAAHGLRISHDRTSVVALAAL